VSPAAVEDAFVKANPGLSQSGLAVGCDNKRLTEVRICLSRELQCQDCPEIARRSCCRESGARATTARSVDLRFTVQISEKSLCSSYLSIY
jgi:ribonuclease I